MYTHSLDNIFLPKEGIRKRVSSYDRKGGNDDRIHIKPGENRIIFDVHTSGLIEHIWMTQMNEGDKIEEQAFRKILIKIYWEDEAYPSVIVPLGDFFGLGHGVSHNFVSEPLQMSPQEGRALNSWWPMPFKKAARIEILNECDLELMLYYYIDYEERSFDSEIMYFGAIWNRVNPCLGISQEGVSRAYYQFGGENLSGEDNYLIMEIEGRGHYVGCHLDIVNTDPTTLHDWPGEGDDMIFIDDDPSLTIFGTGTEDYFGSSWCPTEEYNAPNHGIILPGDDNWKGLISYYRYHIKDPITFRKKIRVTIEHGHCNHRSDDYSSTAYFYLDKPHLNKDGILPVSGRVTLFANKN